MNEFQEELSLMGIKEKIFKINDMYNPRLVANLSKEANDIYLARKSICEEVQKLLDKEDIDLDKVKDYIKGQIKKIKNQLKQAQSDDEINAIKITLKEWEEFL